jgi:hypothetical protein
MCAQPDGQEKKTAVAQYKVRCPGSPLDSKLEFVVPGLGPHLKVTLLIETIQAIHGTAGFPVACLEKPGRRGRAR